MNAADENERPRGRLGLPQRVPKTAVPAAAAASPHADLSFDADAFRAATSAASAGPQTRHSARATGSEAPGRTASAASSARSSRQPLSSSRHNPMQRPESQPLSARSTTRSGGGTGGKVPSYLQPTASSSTRKEIAPLGTKCAPPPAVNKPTVYELGPSGGASSVAAAAAISPPVAPASAVSPLLMLPTPAMHSLSAQSTTRSSAERAVCERGKEASEAATAAAFAQSSADACAALAAGVAKLARQASTDRMAVQAANTARAALDASAAPAEGLLIDLGEPSSSDGYSTFGMRRPPSELSSQESFGESSALSSLQVADDSMEGLGDGPPLGYAPAPSASDIDLLAMVDLSADSAGLVPSAVIRDNTHSDTRSGAGRPPVPCIEPPAPAPAMSASSSAAPTVSSTRGRQLSSGEGRQLLNESFGSSFTYPAAPKSPLIRFSPGRSNAPDRSQRLSRSPKRSPAARMQQAQGAYMERSPGRNASNRDESDDKGLASPLASGTVGSNVCSARGNYSREADRRGERSSNKRPKRAHSTPAFSAASCDEGSPLVPLHVRPAFGEAMGLLQPIQMADVADNDAADNDAADGAPGSHQPPPLTHQSSAPATLLPGTPNGRSLPASRRPPPAPPMVSSQPPLPAHAAAHAAAPLMSVSDAAAATVPPAAIPPPAKLRGDDRPLKRPEAFQMPTEYGPEAYPPGQYPPEAWPAEATPAISAAAAPKKLRGDDRPLKRPTGEKWKPPDEFPPEAFAPADGSRAGAWGERPLKQSPRGAGGGGASARSSGGASSSRGGAGGGGSRLAALATTSGMAAAAAPVAAPLPKTKAALVSALAEASEGLKGYDLDWEKRSAAIHLIPPMLSRAIEIGDGAFEALVEALVHSRAFNVQCADLRSAIVRVACGALGVIAKEHGRQVAPLAASVLPTLFKGLYVAKLPISSACNEAGRELVIAAPTSSTLSVLLAHANDSHHQCRKGVAEYVAAMLNATGTAAGDSTARGAFGGAQADAMLKAIGALTADSNGPVREAAARAWWLLRAKWPEQADASRAKMDPAQRKLLARLEPKA